MGTITKALNLLNYFSENRHELGLMDFRSLTRADKATIHRHLVELQANGYLEQNRMTRKYRLGVAVLRLAAIRERTFPARRIVSQLVERLSREIGELVHASVIQHFEMSPLCFSDFGTGGTRVFFSEAEMLPLHATASGLAALAFGDPALSAFVLGAKKRKYTEFTLTSADELDKHISKTRESGFAFIEQSYEREVSSIAVPFYETDGYAYGTISIAVPTSRMNDTCRIRFARALVSTTKTISNELGGSIPKQLEETWRQAAWSATTEEHEGDSE